MLANCVIASASEDKGKALQVTELIVLP